MLIIPMVLSWPSFNWEIISSFLRIPAGLMKGKMPSRTSTSARAANRSYQLTTLPSGTDYCTEGDCTSAADAGSLAAGLELLKYLKKSELGSSTIRSFWLLKVCSYALRLR